jgi:exodeoxyribonuclease VII small subunit
MAERNGVRAQGEDGWAAGGEPPSYAAAEAELEEILTALEDEAVDVDQLSGHVQRAKALITWCRQRVAQAELAVTELLADED